MVSQDSYLKTDLLKSGFLNKFRIVPEAKALNIIKNNNNNNKIEIKLASNHKFLGEQGRELYLSGAFHVTHVPKRFPDTDGSSLKTRVSSLKTQTLGS